jgi:hypothetical protein
MAIENLKSSAITNVTATPLVKTNAPIAGGLLKEAVGSITPAAAASATSTYKFLRVPSNCRISQVLLSCADFTTAGAIDIGVFETSENGGAAVDADFFATAIDLSGGPMNDLVCTNESGTNTPAKQEQPLWQALGLSADTGKEYVIGATVTTDFNGGQAMVLKVRYAV